MPTGSKRGCAPRACRWRAAGRSRWTQLTGVLMAADAHLVTLRPQFSGIVLPSKIYGCLASRRPIVFIGPQSSDVHRLCLENAGTLSYRHVNPGDPVAFAAALELLADAGDIAPSADPDRLGATLQAAQHHWSDGDIGVR